MTVAVIPFSKLETLPLKNQRSETKTIMMQATPYWYLIGILEGP